MEKKQNKRAVVVGIFVCLGLLIFFVLIFTLGGDKKTFSKKIPVKAVFDDVQGLKAGDNVLVFPA